MLRSFAKSVSVYGVSDYEDEIESKLREERDMIMRRVERLTWIRDTLRSEDFDIYLEFSNDGMDECSADPKWIAKLAFIRTLKEGRFLIESGLI